MARKLKHHLRQLAPQNFRRIRARRGDENPPQCKDESRAPAPFDRRDPPSASPTPARCACTSSEGNPVHGESVATRASPLSITAVTPSIVTELSATLVDRITFRGPRGRDRPILLLGRKIAVQRNHQQVRAFQARASHGEFPPLREETPARRRRAFPKPFNRLCNLFLQRRSRMRRVLDLQIEELSFGAQDRTIVEKSRDWRGIERRRHHHDAARRFSSAAPSARSLSRCRS